MTTWGDIGSQPTQIPRPRNQASPEAEEALAALRRKLANPGMTPQLFYPVTLDSLKDKLTEDVELAFARWYHTPLTITPDDMRDMASWLELAFRAGAYWQRDMTDWKEAVEHGRIPETVQGQNRPTEQAPERQE